MAKIKCVCVTRAALSQPDAGWGVRDDVLIVVVDYRVPPSQVDRVVDQARLANDVHSLIPVLHFPDEHQPAVNVAVTQGKSCRFLSQRE
jgi:hypothetical protein